MTEKDHELLEAIKELSDSVRGSQNKVTISVDDFLSLNNKIIDLKKQIYDLRIDNNNLKHRVDYFAERLRITPEIFESLYALDVITCANERDQVVDYRISFKVDMGEHGLLL